MVSLNYVPFFNQMSMHDITKHELSSVMYYDIGNYIMNPKECVNAGMYLFSLSCRSPNDSVKKKIFTIQ